MTGFASILDPRAIGVTHAISTLLRAAMKAADDALHEAKRAGRNRVVTAE